MSSTTGIEWPSQPTEKVRAFFAAMDSDRPRQVVEWMTPDFEFMVLFSTGSAEPITEFGGGLAEWDGYMAARPTEDRPRHDLTLLSSEGNLAIGVGTTRLGGAIAATFTAAFTFDQDGWIRRYFAGRTPTLTLE